MAESVSAKQQKANTMNAIREATQFGERMRNGVFTDERSRYEERQRRRRANASARASSVEARLEELDDMEKSLYDDYNAGKIDESTFDFELEGIALSRALVRNRPY